MSDFFDQDTGNDAQELDESLQPEGCCAKINGSYVPIEIGSPVIPTCKNLAKNAGFGKFKVWINGVHFKPSELQENGPFEFGPDHMVEIRPFDEAG